MEDTGESTLSGSDFPATNHEHKSGVDRSNDGVPDQLSVVNAEPSTAEGSILVDTLSQLLHATPGVLDPSLGLLDDPASLIQSNLSIDSSLLASLTAGSTTTGDKGCPASGLTVTEDGGTGCDAVEQLAPGALTELNISQLASSLMDLPLLSIPTAKGGSLLADSDFQGSIMDQISPPTILPDLNMAMAEGLAVVASTVEQMSGLPATEGDSTEQVIPVAASAVPSVSSAVFPGSLPAEVVPVDPSAALPVQQGSIAPQVQHSGPNIAEKSSSIAASASTTLTAPATTPYLSSSSPVAHGMRPQGPTSGTKMVYTPEASLLQSTSLSAVPQSVSVAASLSNTASAIGLSRTVTSVGAAMSQFPPPCAVTPLTRSSLSTPSSLPTALPPQQTSSSLTSQAVGSSSSASTLAKGLNLPLLQFLNLNFPSLKIKDLQDVLSINTLLTQVLKQQLNSSSSPAVSLQQLTETSRVGQSTPKASFPTIPSVTTVQSSSGGSRVAGTPFMLSKPGSSPAASGASLRLGIQTGSSLSSQPASSLGVASSSKPLFPFTSGATQLRITAAGKAVDHNTQLASTGLGINVDLLSKQSSSLLSTLASPTAATSTSAGNRKAVLVQILNKTQSTTPTTVTTTPPSKEPILIPRMKSLSKSPLILNRHSRSQSPSLSTSSPTTTVSPVARSRTLTSASSNPSTPVSSLCVSLSLPALKGSQQEQTEKRRRMPLRKSAHQTTTDTSQSHQQLSRTVVQPAESEAMEVDVGQPVQKMKLPKHLKDHSYSLYNPEEAEKHRLLSARNFSFVSSIPPTRLSYAPQVPDSPSTFHKLLKVLPKKNSRQLQSPPHSSRGFGRRGRGGRRGGRGQNRGRGKGSTKKPGLTPTLEPVSEPSSSDQSDSEELSRKVKTYCPLLLHVVRCV